MKMWLGGERRGTRVGMGGCQGWDGAVVGRSGSIYILSSLTHLSFSTQTCISKTDGTDPSWQIRSSELLQGKGRNAFLPWEDLVGLKTSTGMQHLYGCQGHPKALICTTGYFSKHPTYSFPVLWCFSLVYLLVPPFLAFLVPVFLIGLLSLYGRWFQGAAM